MWISLIIALLTYFLSPRDTSKERRAALLGAAAAGAVTYGVTEYTDWGQTNLAPLDDEIGSFLLPTQQAGTTVVDSGAQNPAGSALPSSLWDKLTSWVGPGLAAVGAGTVLGSSGSWLPLAAIGVGIFLLLK